MQNDLTILLKTPPDKLTEIQKIQIRFNSYVAHNYDVTWNKAGKKQTYKIAA